MKSVGSEMASMITVLSIPVIIGLIFPWKALGFKSSDRCRQSAVISKFVNLSEENERDAVRRARYSWRGDVGDVMRMHVDMTFDDLPDMKNEPVLTLGKSLKAKEMPRMEYTIPEYLPRRASMATMKLEDEGSIESDEGFVFSKEEMLKIK